MFLKSSACGSLLILCKLGNGERHHSSLVRSRDVPSIALKMLGKERDCSQSTCVRVSRMSSQTTFLTTRKAAESGRKPKSTRPTDFCRMCTSSFAIRGEYIPKVSHGVALVNYNEHMNSLFSKNVCSPVKIRFVTEHVDIIDVFSPLFITFFSSLDK